MNPRTGLSTFALLVGALLLNAAGCTSEPGADCNDAAQCPDTGTECVLAACSAGSCSTANVAEFTPTAAGQVAGDCKVRVCDGSGGEEVIAADADLPAPSDACHVGACAAGAPSEAPAPEGTACAFAGGLVCDASGNCVECNGDGDCAGPTPTCDLAAHTCVSPACSDGTQNGNESDVDCGGSCGSTCLAGERCIVGNDCTTRFCDGATSRCAYKAQGAACGGSAECSTSFCIDGVCCDTSCGASCQACTAAKGSGPDGVCGSIALGSDPDAECSVEAAASCGNAGGCDGAGACRKYPATTVCRGSAGPCDVAEQCPGNGTACPGDAYASNATLCRASTGACDPAESCTGSSAVCPSDGTLCGAACGGCSVGQACGVDADCLSGMCYGGLCVASVNGCDVATATDLTGGTSSVVTFPNGNFTYAPACIKVSAGTNVQFNGAFGSHPLLGGEVSGGTAVPASSGPFVPVTNVGTTRTFTLSSAGTFPYYCTAHYSLGMAGAVFVVP